MDDDRLSTHEQRGTKARHFVRPPTPVEIRAACHQLQATWTKEEERKHLARRTDPVAIHPWQPPIISVDSLDTDRRQIKDE